LMFNYNSTFCLWRFCTETHVGIYTDLTQT
jgi:hypothetical protein